MTRAAVILAGGAGTRLRPLSSDENPKQFLKLFDGKSLLQLTWERVARLLPPEAIFVSTNVQYADKCREHLPRMPHENVLAEPARRNTAPAIALCTFAIEERLGPCTVSFLASDHYIGDEEEFVRVLRRAYEFAETHDELVTIAIEPADPNTGYGYLELGETLEEDVLRVRSFKEKPDLATAEEFLRAGNYAWNASMFVWRSDVFRRELTAAAPEIARVSEATYEEMPSISIDYALMEKAPRVATLRGDFDWSDVGSFDALRRVGVDVDGLLASIPPPQ
ncbi:MAG TPA: mannose-1-phosphate guanylyltransferase [Thermoanaerobaculia bacterium]|nr:mannose-1-phosphate guanylyltransferase [Thermoanaerobaculia bacterium]